MEITEPTGSGQTVYRGRREGTGGAGGWGGGGGKGVQHRPASKKQQIRATVDFRTAAWGGSYPCIRQVRDWLCPSVLSTYFPSETFPVEQSS